MFSQDKESPVEKVEFKFFHPALDGFWDWPSKLDQQFVSAKFIFYGPCMPEPPVPQFQKDLNSKLKTRKRRKHYINFLISIGILPWGVFDALTTLQSLRSYAFHILVSALRWLYNLPKILNNRFIKQHDMDQSTTKP